MKGNETDEALSILQIEGYITSELEELYKLRSEIKRFRDQIVESIENDAKFRELNKKAQEARGVALAYKRAMMKDPSMVALDDRLDGLKSDLKDVRASLSDYIREYCRISRMRQIEIDGTLMEIEDAYKLVRRG